MRVGAAVWAFLWVWGCAGSAVAAEGGASSDWLFGRVVLVLGLVCLLAYVGIRLGGSRLKGDPGGIVEVVERVPLGPRRAVFVLRLGAKLVLVGSSDAGLQHLGTFEGGVSCAELPSEESGFPEEGTGGEFAAALKAARSGASEMFHVKQGALDD